MDSKQKNRIKRSAQFKFAAVVAILAAWISIPMVTAKMRSIDEPVLLTRTANLASPSGSINPHGAAEFQLGVSGSRELEVEVEDVSQPAGTVFTAFIDGSNVGTLTVTSQRKAKLKLRTEDGQSVPNVNDGSTVEVRDGSNVVVAGVFGGGGTNPTPSPSASPSASPTGNPTGSPSPSPTGSPTGSPSPSPTGSPNAGNLFAALSGPTINGAVPTGYAEYEIHSSRTEIEVRISRINVAGGTTYPVTIGGVAVGNISISSNEGRLRLRSDRGEVVPVVTAGTAIQVGSILNGTFAGMTGPTPSPSPTPGGTPGPTPSPSPSFGRSFEANLTGAGMTPPVTTSATGEVKVALSADETQATIFGEFHGLSSSQTGARIETSLGTVTQIADLGVVGGINGNFPTRTIAVSAAQVQQLRAGLWFAVITSTANPAGEIGSAFRQQSSSSDFDGDGSSDLAVFRPSNSTWYSLNDAGFNAVGFGSANDKLVSGDFDGDGRSDAAVYQNINGQGVWNIRRSSDNGLTTVSFGLATDIPVRADIDGDGRLDMAVFRPSNGTWYVLKSDNSGVAYYQFGANGDIPVPADMDGDGKSDIAVYRPSEGNWYWLNSSTGQFRGIHFGSPGDVPVSGDFDGDGKGDAAVYRASAGAWYVFRSSDSQFYGVGFGLSTDMPVAADYDKDGKTDVAVFRPSEGIWYMLRSSDGAFAAMQFGMSGDKPLVAR